MCGTLVPSPTDSATGANDCLPKGVITVGCRVRHLEDPPPGAHVVDAAAAAFACWREERESTLPLLLPASPPIVRHRGLVGNALATNL